MELEKEETKASSTAERGVTKEEMKWWSENEAGRGQLSYQSGFLVVEKGEGVKGCTVKGTCRGGVCETSRNAFSSLKRFL